MNKDSNIEAVLKTLALIAQDIKEIKETVEGKRIKEHDFVGPVSTSTARTASTPKGTSKLDTIERLKT